MGRYIIIHIVLLMCFQGVLFAETMDISDDLQKTIQSPSAAPLQSAVEQVQPNKPPGVDGTQVMKDIIDIKPLEKIGYDKRWIKYGLILLTVILLVCLLIYLIDYFIRRRKKEVVEDVVVIPADVEAYQLLDDLKRENHRDAREYYFRLTAILRGYIGKRFRIDAPEMTTEELLPKLNELDCDKKLIQNIKSVLTSTDPVKYAGVDAVIDKMEGDFTIVRDFVRLTPFIESDPEEEGQDV